MLSLVFRWSCFWQERQHSAYRCGLQARDHARGHHEATPEDPLRVEALAQQQQPKEARPQRLGRDEDGRVRPRHLGETCRLAHPHQRRGGQAGPQQAWVELGQEGGLDLGFRVRVRVRVQGGGGGGLGSGLR